MTLVDRLVFALFIALTYLVCCWPLGVVSAVGFFSFFGGKPESMSAALSIYCAILGLPAAVVTFILRRLDRESALWWPAASVWVVLALYIGVPWTAETAPPQYTDHWLLSRSMMVAGRFAASLKQGLPAMVTLCVLPGLGGFAATFFRRAELHRLHIRRAG